MRNSYLLTITLVASLFLFVFIYPQGINKGIDAVNTKSPLKMGYLPKFFEALPFHLGLDLLGGAHLVYEAQLKDVPDADRADAMAGVRDVVERRVNYFGVSEPVVQVSGENRLIVELAGIKDVNQAIELIGQTPFLEFKETAPNAEELVSQQKDPFVPTGLNGKHLKRAQLVFQQQIGTPEVSLELNEEGTKLFAEITKRNVGNVVAIFLDGEIISAPVVQAVIETGQAVISGGSLNNINEAKLLVTRLNSGALPVPIALVSQQTVGASLGTESLNMSLTAGIWGLLGVAAFMIIFYRLPGLIAVIALMVYLILTLFIYKLIPVTLTLAGIAGFILSMGMSVDTNVLIFARMKEELAAGKSLQVAVKEAFSRAWLSIRDSHVTTLISSIALYIFTTSIVKGFALTLGIGVLLSLFTAISVSRALLALFTGPFFEKRKWLFK